MNDELETMKQFVPLFLNFLKYLIQVYVSDLIVLFSNTLFFDSLISLDIFVIPIS
jgi:hypothetical protein